MTKKDTRRTRCSRGAGAPRAGRAGLVVPAGPARVGGRARRAADVVLGATGNAVASCPTNGVDACIDSVVTDFDQRPTRHLTIHRYRSYSWRVASGNGRHLGLAELVALLSLGTDLGLGQPMEHMVRACLIALRLAEHLGLDESQRTVLYYSGLLAWVVCHTDAYEQAKWLGDELAVKRDAHYGYDFGRAMPATAFMCEEEGFLIVGECADGADVLDAVRRDRPEIVVMDVRMPRMNAAEATRQLRERVSEPPPVLILTTF